MKLDIIYNEDCLEGMKRLPDESIDLIIADIPYESTEVSWQILGYQKLKRTGSMYIFNWSENLAALYNSFIGNKRWLVWAYTNKVVPTLEFWQRTHESVLMIYKEIPYFNREAGRVEYSEMYRQFIGKTRKGMKSRFGEKDTIFADNKGALPRDVIRIQTLAGFNKEKQLHRNQKPLKLIEYLIEVSSKENDLVLDPFMGSGTTAVACKRLNRRYIGFETSKKYCDIAKARLEAEKTLWD